MKKIIVFFVITSLIFIAGQVGFSQALVSHSFQQDIEVSVPGKGGPTLIKQGETKILPYLIKNGTEKVIVRYRVGRNSYATRQTVLPVVNGKAELPLAEDAFVEKEAPTKSAPEKEPQQTFSSDSSPKIGDVNIIKGLKTPIDQFQIKVVNKTSKGDLLFIGDVFTGAAFSQGDTITSTSMVRPGLIELNVLYQDNFFQKNEMLGKPLIFSQQSIVAMVTSSQRIIIIEDNHFFDVYSLAPDLKVVFKNAGSKALMSNPASRRPLRPGRKSQVYTFEDAMKLSWSFADKGVLRTLIMSILPNSSIIEVSPYDEVLKK